MRPATVRDVARLAQVSIGTVSNYLNDSKPIGEATRTRIEEAIERLNFVPNNAVRIVLGGRAPATAFLLPDGGNPVFAEVARGIEDVSLAQGRVVMSCNTDGETLREQQYARALAETRIHSAIAVASGTSTDTLTMLRQAGVRVVLIGPHADPTISSVTVDDEQGGYLATRHVLELGHRDIAYFGGPGGTPQIDQRLRGVVQALAERGLPSDALQRIDALGSSAHERMRAAARLIELSRRPTAVICANDLLAIALQSVAVRRGVRIPDELSIVGYDDIESASTSPVLLTTIHQPLYLLGRTAAELAGSDGPAEHIVFTPELVVRESAAIAPDTRA